MINKPKTHCVSWLFWADGWTPTPGCIFVSKRLSAAQQELLLEHERVHVAQMLAHGWLRWVGRYAFSRRWRLAYELEAYVTSIEASPHTGGPDADILVPQLAQHYASYLSTWWRYWLFKPANLISEQLQQAYRSRQTLREKALCMADAIYAEHTA